MTAEGDITKGFPLGFMSRVDDVWALLAVKRQFEKLLESTIVQGQFPPLKLNVGVNFEGSKFSQRQHREPA